MREELEKLINDKFHADIEYLVQTKDNYCSGSEGTTLNEIRRELKYLACLITLATQKHQILSSLPL